MPSIFSRIIKGEIPCEKILEDDRYFSFLDIRPITQGHTLVIPKLETDDLFDLEDSLLSGALPFAKHIVRALKKTVACRRVGIMVAGFAVPHAHIHLVPLQHEGELSFANARPAKAEDLSTLAQRIRQNL